MTEGRKDDIGKSRLDLIPLGPLWTVAEVLERGAKRYGVDNWRRVPNAKNRYYAALLRHIFAWRGGEILDPETELPHLAHALANVMFLMEDRGETTAPRGKDNGID
jgi:hypothetical protein